MLPLEQANKKLIMPIPYPEPIPRVGKLERVDFIVVVVVVVGGVLLILSALLLFVLNKRQKIKKMMALLAIQPEQLEIINLPVVRITLRASAAVCVNCFCGTMCCSLHDRHVRCEHA